MSSPAQDLDRALTALGQAIAQLGHTVEHEPFCLPRCFVCGSTNDLRPGHLDPPGMCWHCHAEVQKPFPQPRVTSWGRS